MNNNSLNKELLQSFLNYLTFEKKSSNNTVVSYKNDLNSFMQAVQPKFFFDVDTKDIRLWISTLSQEGISPRTINRKITAVRSFFYFLQKEGKVKNNVAKKIHTIKVTKRLPLFVEEENINNLLDNELFPKNFSGLRDKVVIEMLYTLGIRRSELLNLTIQSINFQESTIRIIGKGNKERILPILPECEQLLKQYLAERNTIVTKTNALIITNKGEKAYANLIYRITNKYLNKVTTIEKKSPHILRHTFATHLLNNGADINDIKKLLGHATLAATQVYTHNSFEKLKEVYKQSHPRN